MKMAKKLVAIALAGVMALTVLTGCGDSVSNKKIVDALNDMAKIDDNGITFTEKSELNAKAKALADAIKKDVESGKTTVLTEEGGAEGSEGEEKPATSTEITKVLPATANTFMWVTIVETKNMSTSAQAHKIYANLVDEDNALNAKFVPDDKVAASAREIGFANITVNGKSGRLVIATAAAEDTKSEKPSEPTEPTEPSEPTEPTEPTVPVTPVEPIE